MLGLIDTRFVGAPQTDITGPSGDDGGSIASEIAGNGLEPLDSASAPVSGEPGASGAQAVLMSKQEALTRAHQHLKQLSEPLVPEQRDCEYAICGYLRQMLPWSSDATVTTLHHQLSVRMDALLAEGINHGNTPDEVGRVTFCAATKS